MKLYKAFIPLSKSGLLKWDMNGVGGEVLADDRADSLSQLLEHGLECEGFERKDLRTGKAISSQSKCNLESYSRDDACNWCDRVW